MAQEMLKIEIALTDDGRVHTTLSKCHDREISQGVIDLLQMGMLTLVTSVLTRERLIKEGDSSHD